jgi:hypothetical protein
VSSVDQIHPGIHGLPEEISILLRVGQPVGAEAYAFDLVVTEDGCSGDGHR